MEESPVQESCGAPIDRSALAQLADPEQGGDVEFVIEIVDAYLTDAPVRLARLRDAARRGDARTVRREAHTLKSACGYVGAHGLRAMCQELERLGEQGSTGPLASLIDRADDELARVAGALDEVRARGL